MKGIQGFTEQGPHILPRGDKNEISENTLINLLELNNILLLLYDWADFNLSLALDEEDSSLFN